MFFNKKINRRKVNNIIFCLFLSLFFILIPWENILNSIYFEDRIMNRLIRGDNSFSKLEYYDTYYSNFFSYISQEWGWEILFYIFRDSLGLSANTIFNMIAFLAAFLSFIFVSERFRFSYVVYLFNPWFFDFIYSQSRLAFAISLIYLAYIFRKNIFLLMFFLFFSLLVHSSILIFLSILFFSYYINYKSNFMIKTPLLIVYGFLVSLITGPFFVKILNYLGDKRGDVYSELDMSSSVFDVLIWILLLFSYLFFISIKRIKLDFCASVLIIILSIVFFNTVIFESYVVRFLMALYPILIVSVIKNLDKFLIILFSLVYFLYIFIGWFFRLFLYWS